MKLSYDDHGSITVMTLSGELTGTNVTGLGMDEISYTGVESLDLVLGSGSDAFEFLSTNPNTVATVAFGEGDDQITVDSSRIGGAIIVKADLNGTAAAGVDFGNNTVTVEIPGDPAVVDLTDTLRLNDVRTLIVDNSTNPTPVDW